MQSGTKKHPAMCHNYYLRFFQVSRFGLDNTIRQDNALQYHCIIFIRDSLDWECIHPLLTNFEHNNISPCIYELELNIHSHRLAVAMTHDFSTTIHQNYLKF